VEVESSEKDTWLDWRNNYICWWLAKVRFIAVFLPPWMLISYNYRTENQTTDDWYKLVKSGSSSSGKASLIHIVLKLERVDDVNFMQPIKPQSSPTAVASASPPSDEDQQFYSTSSIPELRSPVAPRSSTAITVDGISLIELNDSDDEQEEEQISSMYSETAMLFTHSLVAFRLNSIGRHQWHHRIQSVATWWQCRTSSGKLWLLTNSEQDSH